MDRFDAMTTLLTVVEEGSLSAASRRLRMPLATVSRKVSELEAHLRTQLLVRSTRRLSLTEAGHDYVIACRRILDEVEDAERIVSGEYVRPKGELVISAPVVFGRLHILPLVMEFLALYPEIDIRLLLTDRVVSHDEDHVHLAVRISELADSGLIARKIGEICRVVCASPDYLERRGTPMRPAELAGHDCVTFDGLMLADSWTFNYQQKVETVRLRPRLVVNSADAAICAALASTGITRVLSYQAIDHVRSGKLVLVLREFEPKPVPVSLVYAAQLRLPLKLRAFIDFAQPILQQRVDAIANQS